MAKTFTVDDLTGMGWCAPYTPERFAQIYAGQDEMSLVEMLQQTDVPAVDRLFCVSKLVGDDALCRHVACDIAESMIASFPGHPPERLQAVVDAARKHADGEVLYESMVEKRKLVRCTGIFEAVTRKSGRSSLRETFGMAVELGGDAEELLGMFVERIGE